MTRHRRRRPRSFLVGQLGQPVQDPLRYHEFLPLSLDLLQLLGQLRSERAQFTPASRDPLLLSHPHALPRAPGGTSR